ncbi:MAG: hypothetical protein V2I43_16905 [Parvularcula sp.]|jgi:hypothetical protein|nr:hypothetical protein [Parvularcula sp.]
MSTDHKDILPEERSVFETPGTLRAIWIGVPAACAVFALMNVVLAVQHKTHPHFAIDSFPVFYGVVGFVSFAFIVLAGQHLRKILMRPEGYYDGAEAELPRDGGDEAVSVDDISVGDDR